MSKNRLNVGSEERSEGNDVGHTETFAALHRLTASRSVSGADLRGAGNNNYSDFLLISTGDELEALQPSFSRLLVDRVGREAAIYACPAEMRDGSIVVFHTPEYADSSVLGQVVALLKKERDEEPIRIQVAPTLLLTLVYEGKSAAQNISSSGDDDSDRSMLGQAFKNIVTWAVEKNASDIHINIDLNHYESQIFATIDGHYIAPPHWRLPSGHLLDIAKVAWLSNKGGTGTVLDLRNEQQGRLYEVIHGRPYMLRWGSFIADAGPSITLRVQDLAGSHALQSFEDMGYLPSQAEMLNRAQLSEGGAIVLGGVPGSGKTTTIANLLAALPLTRKIMSIEDPVERRIEGALQATISRGVDGDDPFHSKLMMLKRSAPSDAFLGEIRDTVTGRAFQDISESGTNLYSTVHAVSALAIPERLASRQVGVPIELLAMPNILKLVGYQALLPVLCGCSQPFSSLFEGGPNAVGKYVDGEGWRKYEAMLQTIYQVDVSGVRVRNVSGCPACQASGLPDIYGYSGRTVVAELFEIGQYRDALTAVRNRDVVALTDFYEGLRTTGYGSHDMTGKSAMDAAVYKMLLGQLDPRDIEPRFQTFRSVAQMRNITY